MVRGPDVRMHTGKAKHQKKVLWILPHETFSVW